MTDKEIASLANALSKSEDWKSISITKRYGKGTKKEK